MNIWNENKNAPYAGEAKKLSGVRFEVVKKREKEQDGYNFAHGAACVFFKDKLYVSWGANKGAENTAGEETLVRFSSDFGKSWSSFSSIGDVKEGQGRSHGAFLTYGGRLYAFNAVFFEGKKGHFPGLSTEAFVLEEETESWKSLGIVCEDFWSLREPVLMDNGNLLMTGCDADWKATVAISEGNNLLKWRTVKIPFDTGFSTEASAWIEENEVCAVMRNQLDKNATGITAAVSISRDFGESFPKAQPGNLPMNTSKPYCGILSTGQRYVIGNSIREANHSRAYLTIAVSKPFEKQLSEIYLICDGELPQQLKEIYGVDAAIGYSYPYAVEKDGNLIVVYSAIHTHSQEGRMFWNINDIELAVIPIEELK